MGLGMFQYLVAGGSRDVQRDEGGEKGVSIRQTRNNGFLLWLGRELIEEKHGVITKGDKKSQQAYVVVEEGGGNQGVAILRF